jgi:hypothetical protein
MKKVYVFILLLSTLSACTVSISFAGRKQTSETKSKIADKGNSDNSNNDMVAVTEPPTKSKKADKHRKKTKQSRSERHSNTEGMIASANPQEVADNYEVSRKSKRADKHRKKTKQPRSKRSSNTEGELSSPTQQEVAVRSDVPTNTYTGSSWLNNENYTFSSTAPKNTGLYYKILLKVTTEYNESDYRIVRNLNIGHVDSEFESVKERYFVVLGDFKSLKETKQALQKVRYINTFKYSEMILYKNGDRIKYVQ